jgi:hypothetical protein
LNAATSGPVSHKIMRTQPRRPPHDRDTSGTYRGSGQDPPGPATSQPAQTDAAAEERPLLAPPPRHPLAHDLPCTQFSPPAAPRTVPARPEPACWSAITGHYGRRTHWRRRRAQRPAGSTRSRRSRCAATGRTRPPPACGNPPARMISQIPPSRSPEPAAAPMTTARQPLTCGSAAEANRPNP